MLDQHWEQDSPVHLDEPSGQCLYVLSGKHQIMTFLSSGHVCSFPWESWKVLDRLHLLPAQYLKAVPPKKGALSSCVQTQGQPPFPWCSCSSPLPEGTEVQVGLDEGGETETESVRQRETEKERHLLLISMGKFPRSWRRGWSPPDRACWLLRGSPFLRRLPRASWAVSQSNPFKWADLCLLHAVTHWHTQQHKLQWLVI